MNKYASIFICVLTGCGIPLSDANPDPVELEAVQIAWNDDTTLPSINACDASKVHVTVLYPLEFEKVTTYRACGVNPVAPCAYAASWPEKDGVWEIVIAYTTVHKLKAQRHELVHWLAYCSNDKFWGDPGHTDMRLWGAGNPDTVEGRASILAGDE